MNNSATAPLLFYTYDIETLRNCFLFAGKFEDRPEVYVFEISSRKNQRTELLQHLNWLKYTGAILNGFNNIGFDYQIIHDLMVNPHTFTFETAYNYAQTIINSPRFGEGASFNTLRHTERILPQLDLFKLNHFDNRAKSTSLKALQFAMQSEVVQDLPFEHDKWLTSEEIDLSIAYNIHDVTETERFLKRCKAQIALRKELLDTGTLKGDVLNYSDVKIGVEYLLTKIGRNKCFLPGNKPRKTFREKVVFSEIILDKIQFKTEPYQEVHKWFMNQVKYTVAKENPALEVHLAGLDFKFGVGGIHASVESKVFASDAEMIIEDVDITGAYVATAIENGFAPEHLGDDFRVAYKGLKTDRARYKKGTVMNKTLKLSGNGAFGNFDNQYSFLYDPKCAKQCTVNCQLSILQLVECFDLIPQLQIIQANTDGITAYYPRKYKHLFDMWKIWWEGQTGLQLESVEYKKMWTRDVNNYLALGVDGKVKRKGAYWYPETEEDYDGVWNKDFSMMVVPKVVSECLINGWNPDALIRMFTDPFDFMLRYKTPKESTVFLGDQAMPKTVRYYVSTQGRPMRKESVPRGPAGHFCRANSLTDDHYEKTLAQTPVETVTLENGQVIQRPQHNPLIHTKNKSTYGKVITSIESGFLIKECNNAKTFDWSDLNYEYYVEQVRKLMF